MHHSKITMFKKTMIKCLESIFPLFFKIISNLRTFWTVLKYHIWLLIDYFLENWLDILKICQSSKIRPRPDRTPAEEKINEKN